MSTQTGDPASSDTSSTPTVQLSSSDVQALGTGLTSEYAAVYAYGIVAAYGNPTRADQIAGHAAEHRARRDAVIDLLRKAGATIPRAAAGYTLPFPVTDPISSARLAVRIEKDCTVAWRSAVEHASSDQVRSVGVDALTTAAVAAGNWQVALGTVPPTVAFPGHP